MIRRYHIRNLTHMAEFPFTPAGLMQAKAFRSAHPEFKRRRIRDVFQALPSTIQLGVMTALTPRRG